MQAIQLNGIQELDENLHSLSQKESVDKSFKDNMHSIEEKRLSFRQEHQSY